MENNEIINNEEVIETVETAAKTDCGKVFKTAAKAGIVVIGGIMIYKFIAKPAIAKIKNKKNSTEKESTADYDIIDEEVTEEIDDEK